MGHTGNRESAASKTETHSNQELLFAKQPILDVNRELVAYEVLFRGDFDSIDGKQASARVLLNAFDEGLLRLEPDAPPLFVNFTRDLLFNLPPFDPQCLVVEILEDVEATPEVVAQVGMLKQAGYQIALDDFVYRESLVPLLEVADIVKVDVMDTPLQDLPELVHRLRRFGVKLLAEKVEDYETFYECRKLGFDWYQGYFFARPETVAGSSIGPNRAAVLTMVAALQDPYLEQSALEGIILSDSGLSYKVLRLSNSAALRRSVSINTVPHAIAMLGTHRLQNFATLVALSDLGEKPAELQVYATYRSLLCERLGEQVLSDTPAELFQTVGILSCCDAYFGQPLEKLVTHLPLSDTVVEALLQGVGELGVVLNAARTLQETRWDQVDWAALELLGLSRDRVFAIVRETTSWAESATDVELF